MTAPIISGGVDPLTIIDTCGDPLYVEDAGEGASREAFLSFRRPGIDLDRVESCRGLPEAGALALYEWLGRWLPTPPPTALRPMSEAPTTGPVVEILVATTDRAGCRGWLIAHYAEGGGEDQPPFRGWFYWTGYSFRELAAATLLGWLPLPEIP